MIINIVIRQKKGLDSSWFLTFQHPLQALLPLGDFRQEEFGVEIPDFIRWKVAAHTRLRPGETPRTSAVEKNIVDSRL